MNNHNKKPTWSQVRTQLESLDTRALIHLVRDLYDASVENRLFLHSRLLANIPLIEEYRKRVCEALAPSPLGTKPIRASEAKRLTRHYFKATGDPVSAIDLSMFALEVGIEQSIDLGVEGENYFGPLLQMAKDVTRLFPELPEGSRRDALRKFQHLADRSSNIGWGFGDEMQSMLDLIR